MHLPAVLSLLSLPVIIYFQEWFALISFGLMAAVSILIGQLLYQSCKKYKKSNTGFSIVMVGVSWFLIPLMGVISFYVTAILADPNIYPAVSVFNNFTNSFFESMSGYTGTGLTMVDDPSELPYILQWWRSLMEWIGGIGVMVLATIVLGLNHKDSMLYKAETRSWTLEGGSVKDTAKRIWWIYIFYTTISIAAFYLAGMPFWEALNHGITAMGTGGFSVTTNSFVDYDPIIKITGVVIMIAGAIAFKIHYLLLFKRQIHKAFKQTQLMYFLAILFAAVIGLYLMMGGISFTDALFQTASALGTCGLNSVDLSLWQASPLFLLILLMLLGGNAGSTAGGLKTERVAWFTKSVFNNVKEIWSADNEKHPIYFNGEKKEPKVVNRNIKQAASIVFLWMMSLCLGTLSLSLLLDGQFAFEHILFDAASALNNVGLSSGVTTKDLPSAAKYVLSLLMWAGRLEILAVFILISSAVLMLNKKVHF